MLQIGEEEWSSRCELDPEFFPDFASKSVLEQFSGLYSATRKSPLAWIHAAIARHLANQYRTLGVTDDGDNDEANGNT